MYFREIVNIKKIMHCLYLFIQLSYIKNAKKIDLVYYPRENAKKKYYSPFPLEKLKLGGEPKFMSQR